MVDNGFALNPLETAALKSDNATNMIQTHTKISKNHLLFQVSGEAVVISHFNI